MREQKLALKTRTQRNSLAVFFINLSQFAFEFALLESDGKIPKRQTDHYGGEHGPGGEENKRYSEHD